MAVVDSIRFKKESKQCKVAARLAEFLEAHDPNHTYNFVMPDLLEFSCEQTLSRLRENAEWQALESEFKEVRGSVLEDWGCEDDKPDEVIPPLKIQPAPQELSQSSSRTLDLIIISVAISAFIGALIGWFFPHLVFPSLSQEVRIDSHSVGKQCP